MDVDDLFDGNMHNYYKANVEDCVLYYICGYITKNLTKQIKCKDCLTVITGDYLHKNTYFLWTNYKKLNLNSILTITIYF